MKWRLVVTVALALCVALAFGQGYPNKPVKIIVPFTAGSATDILARTVGTEALRDVGAAGRRGEPAGRRRHDRRGRRREVAARRLHADGALRRAGGESRTIYPTLPYDTVKEFVEVATLGGQPNVLVVAPATGFTTTLRSRRRAKKRPGALNYRLRGHGQRHAHQRARNSSSPPASTPAHSVQGHAGSDDRHDDRTRDVLLLAHLGRAAEHPRRQARGAGRVDREALERVAERADDRRRRARRASTTTCGSACTHLPGTPQRHRRQDQRRRREGTRHAGDAREARRAGRRADGR